MHPSFLSCLMGTYIHWVLLFAWVLLFKKWIATGFMGTYIHRVLVFDGYLYSRVYGRKSGLQIPRIYRIRYTSAIKTMVLLAIYSR